MAFLVMYQDLPGGPTLIRFQRYLPHHCLCGQCQMVSLSMLTDPQHHAFCRSCLKERRANHSKTVYCIYENKDVLVEEMFEAPYLTENLRNQYVYCPNVEHCAATVRLQELNDHYTRCKPAVTCLWCSQKVRTEEWKRHIPFCSKQGATNTITEKNNFGTAELPKEQSSWTSLADEPLVKSLSSPENVYQNELCKEVDKDIFDHRSTQNLVAETATARQSPPDVKMSSNNEHINSENSAKLPTEICGYCNGQFKQSDAASHREVCRKRPIPCAYCGYQVLKEEIKSHIAECKQRIERHDKAEPAHVTSTTRQRIGRKVRSSPHFAAATATWSLTHLWRAVTSIFALMLAPLSAIVQPITRLFTSSMRASWPCDVPKWPSVPTYESVYGWFKDVDAHLERKRAESEVEKFDQLMDILPSDVWRLFSKGLKASSKQPRPYTTAKSLIISGFKTGQFEKDPDFLLTAVKGKKMTEK